MFRMFTGPVLAGISVSLLVFFVLPFVYSESAIVAGVADFANNTSNAYFASMPSVVAGYIANLNLAIVAVTAGLLSMIAIQLLVATGIAFARATRSIISLLAKFRKKEESRELPAIDFESSFNGPEKDRILGRGLDSIDRS